MRWLVAICLTACADKPAPSTTVNVRDFGATGDGATDDTAAIQAALRALPTGGTIVVPDGIYRIEVVTDGGGVPLASHQTLELSAGAVLEAIPNDAIEYALVRVYGVTDVMVHGGTLLGDRDSHLGTDGEWGHGVNVRASDQIVIDGVTARGFWGDGFYIGRNLADPPPSHDVRIINCVADSNRRQGLSVTDAYDVEIENNTFMHTHGTAPEGGIDLEPSLDDRTVRDVQIDGNTFLDNTYGVLIVGLAGVNDHATLSGNTITGNRAFGIDLIGTPTAVTIDHNKIRSNTVGVSLDGASTTEIASNLIELNAGEGVRLVGASANNVIGNQIFGNGDETAEFDNVSIRNNSNGNLVRENVVRRGSTARYGVQIATPDCVANSVVSNDLVDAGIVGPLLDLGTATTTTGNSL